MNTPSTRPAEFDYRRPESRQNSNGSPPPDDPWTIPAPVEEAPPGDDILLLRQLLAAQKENVLWSQRAAVIVRDLRDMSFWWLVKLFVKAAFAVIPAAIIIAAIWAIVNAIIAGTIAAVLGLLLVGGSRVDDARPTAAPRPAVVAPIQEVVPTIAPVPVPQIAVQPDSQRAKDLAYLESMRLISKDFMASAGDMNTLIQYVINDNSLLDQPKWNEDVKATYPSFRDVITRIRAIEPTPTFQKSHRRWLEFAVYLESAINAMEAGIPQKDAAKIAEGSKQLSNAKVAMEAALDEMTTDAGL